MNGHGPTRPRRRLAARLGGVLTALAGASVVAVAAIPGVLITGAVPVPDVSGGIFDLDGAIQQDSIAPPYDWSCVFPASSTTGCPPPSSLMVGSVFQQDYALPDVTTFAASNKDIDNVDTWQCGPSNNLLGKDDIQNAYGAAFVPTSGPKANHLLLFLAQERATTTGDSFAGFWLMHQQHACVNGTFTNGAHDVGDLLVVSNYTNGGTTATVELYEWNPSPSGNLQLLGSGFTCGMTPPATVTDPNNICGIANSANVTEPWPPNNTLTPNGFVEVGIDASALIPPPAIGDSSAACFSDFLAETRSSQQTTATLKDFTTGQFHFCVSPSVTTQQTAGSSTSASMTVEKGTTVTDQATLGAPISGTPAGTISYALYDASANCTGTPVFSSPATALGAGGTVPASSPTPATLPVGSYEWQASYSGDIATGGHNFPATSTCGDEPLTVLDASIAITPQTATNAVGNQHVFTITATVVPATTALTSATITTSVSPAPTSQSSTCGSPTISANTATCTLTINSSSVATYTVNASAALGAGGITMHRATDGSAPSGPSGSGPATKNYVDASIAIGPSAVNEVDHSHTFTVTVTAYPGSAGAPSFGAITTSVSPSPTSQSSTCASPTVNGNVATCTLTIDSATSGDFTANAAATVTIGGVVLHRSTDGSSGPHGPGGSGPATKTYVDASVSIGPSAVNPVGQAHVFTIVVTASPASASPVSFGTITPSVTPTPTSISNTCATPVITGDVATCTLTVNSPLAATFAANATATVTMGGVTVTRSTSGNHGPLGSGPATKTYVDASIGITPNSAVNEVNHQHVFTVTVTAVPSGATPVVFNSITPSVSPTPTSQSTTCGSPNVNGDVATCTVTIDSSTAGTFTVNADAVVTMGGTAVSRSTDGSAGPAGPGGTGPATKTFVDAAVAIGPSAVNEVGHSHVFTVTVTAIPGGASPVTFTSITPSVSPTPGSMSTTCGSPHVNGDTATCTVTVNSSSAGVFTADVTAQVTMGGVTVTRSTTGNHGPGGSGPATKTYVDASIAIGPSAVNEVGSSHTFTITATAIPSGASPVSFTSITPSVSPAPTSQSTTCGSPVVNGNTATCTLTIDSSSVATYTANATAVVDMGGVSVTRSTSSNHGPGGSGPATKMYVDASVSIGPPTAINVVGAPHTFTVTVVAMPGDASPVSFGTITPTVSPTPSSMSTTCGSPVVLFAVATCTVTIDSTTAGLFTANVTAQVTMGGVTVTRSTSGNHGPGGSGPALKTYGLATIAIAPSAVNEVGNPHTFTITVTSVPGTTTTFNSITPSVSPAPDSLTTTCGAPVVNGNVATCTVTIDSNSAGVFTATAAADVTVNGFETTVSTNGIDGNSGAATKTYVDASVAIGPTAVNEVGHSHTFTVTVDALAEGQPVTFDSIIPSVSPTPGSLTSTCGSPTVSGDTATCTVTIDSDSAGLFTANAAAVVTAGGVTLHRSTDGTAGGSGPGGSGPAFKTYVDAAVGIGPSAVNPIGKEHVFDVVVTAIPAGATPVTFGAITTSVTPAPLTMSTTCDQPVVSGDQATCTLTVNSDLPTTFAANVTAVVTMGGVTVTRSTSGDHGPGGTGPATKTYVNALITLTPAVATDPVGDIHTLTATVTQDDGSGSGAQPVPDGTDVSLSIVSGPGTLSSPTCTTSGGTGTCTDTLTSAVAGTTTIHATVTVTVKGVSLTRSTGDSVPGDGPDAVKNWFKVSPSIATTQSAGGAPGTALSDTATVSGGHDPSGTVTFQLFAPGDTDCTGTAVFTDTPEPLSGGIAKSAAFAATASGTYQWVAAYSGDAGNTTAVSGCGSEPVTISAPAAVVVRGLSVPLTGVGPAIGWGLLMILAGGLIVRVTRRRRS